MLNGQDLYRRFDSLDCIEYTSRVGGFQMKAQVCEIHHGVGHPRQLLDSMLDF
jgi:hypothetical protein